MGFSLYDAIPGGLPYPIRSGIVRAVRTGLVALLAGVSAALLDGSLLDAVRIVPQEYYPAVTMALTTVFVGVDKWLRERGLLDEAKEEGLVPQSATEIPETEKGDVAVAVEPADKV